MNPYMDLHTWISVNLKSVWSVWRVHDKYVRFHQTRLLYAAARRTQKSSNWPSSRLQGISPPSQSGLGSGLGSVHEYPLPPLSNPPARPIRARTRARCNILMGLPAEITMAFDHEVHNVYQFAFDFVTRADGIADSLPRLWLPW